MTHPVEPPVLIATVNAFLRTRQAERERRDRELEFKAIFENAINGIALISENLLFVDVNPAMCLLLKSPRKQFSTNHCSTLSRTDHHDEATEIFHRLQAEGTWRGVFSLQASDGSLVHLEWNLSTAFGARPLARHRQRYHGAAA